MAHIPLYILSFINGIKPIAQFIIDEMKKFHYYVGVNSPPKKKKIQNIEKNSLTKEQIITNDKNNEENEESADKRINILTINSKKRQNSSIIPVQNNNIIEQIDINKKTELNDMISKDDNFSKAKEKKNKNKNKYLLIKIDANNSNGSVKPPDSNYTLKNYEYESALIYERRTFWRILYIVLLAKDNILNTFILKSPLESKPLRICLLLFTYTSDLALNTLFYFSDNISDKYHYTGEYAFWYTLFNNIIISLISTLLSLILGSILSSMTDSKSSIEKQFIEEEKKMRENKNYIVSKERKQEIIKSIMKSLKCLKIKMIIFVIVDFIILLFFYYFTTAFCSVYQGTQISWITDSIVSIIIGFPIEIGIALVVSIIYKIALKYKCKLFYKLSMIFA